MPFELRLHFDTRTPFADGEPFGDAGPYERLVGRADVLLDPAAGHYRVVRRLQGYSHRRWVGPVLFVFAASPLPMDVAGIVAGTSRYSVWRFVAWVGAGKFLNTVLIALASYYTIDLLQMLFGG